MSGEREIVMETLTNVFGFIGAWLEAEGEPFTPEQQKLIDRLVAGEGWGSL